MMTNPSPSPRRSKRVRYQNMTLMAIAITFILLLIVIAALLCTMLIKGIADRNPQDDTPPADDGGNEENPPDDGGTGEDGGNNNDNGTPQPPRSETVSADRIHTGDLILVNKAHKYEFPANANLVNVYSEQQNAGIRGQYFQLVGSELYMKQNAYMQMNKWLQEVNDPSLVLVGAYRSFEQQEAMNSDIPAGYSDSHAGLSCELRAQNAASQAIQISPATHPFLYETAAKYGFVVRYPDDKGEQTGITGYIKYFRYVGYVHAYLMTTNNLCLEEYIPYLQGHTYGETALKVTTPDGSSYEIYYVPATGESTVVPLPAQGTHTISGDNENGFIVTVKVS